MMYKHWNIYESYKKQVLLIYTLQLLDKYNEILLNAQYLHQDVRQMFAELDSAAGFILVHFY